MRVFSIISVLAATTGMASAQSLTAADWAGAYYGLSLGYSEGDSNHISIGLESGGPDISGGAVALTYGRNFPSASGALVYGVEVDAALTNFSGELPVGSYNGFGCSTGPCQTNVSWLATARGRIGVASGNALYYATAGVAVGGVEGSIPGDPELNEGSQTEIGWTVGIGAEFRVNDRMSWKADILHTDLGEARYDDELVNGNQFLVDTKFTQLRIGLNFRF